MGMDKGASVRASTNASRKPNPGYFWTEYNCGVVEAMLKSKDWKRVTTLDQFAFRWESHNPGGLHDPALRDYVFAQADVEVYMSQPKQEEAGPFDPTEPDPGDEPGEWSVACDKCKRTIILPPAYDKTRWCCNPDDSGCGNLNPVPTHFLAARANGALPDSKGI
jgi:hypothetical protein